MILTSVTKKTKDFNSLGSPGAPCFVPHAEYIVSCANNYS